MDGHASFTLSSLSLLYRYVNVESILTAEHVLSRMFMPSLTLPELLYILGFDLHTVYLTLVDPT
jgi:hypothetical protein